MADLNEAEVERLQTKEYWNSRYAAKQESFDWFKSYADIAPFFQKHIDWNHARELKVLMLGCGNSVCRVIEVVQSLYMSCIELKSTR